MTEFANVYFFLLKNMILGTFLLVLLVALVFLFFCTFIPLFMCVEKSNCLLDYDKMISGYKKTIIYTKVTLLYISGGIATKICLCIWGFIIYWLNLNDFHGRLFFVESGG